MEHSRIWRMIQGWFKILWNGNDDLVFRDFSRQNVMLQSRPEIFHVAYISIKIFTQLDQWWTGAHIYIDSKSRWFYVEPGIKFIFEFSDFLDSGLQRLRQPHYLLTRLPYGNLGNVPWQVFF